jgi:hypothetical protein
MATSAQREVGGHNRVLIRRLVLRAAGASVFPVAGFAWDAFGFPLAGNLLAELVNDVLQLMSGVPTPLIN